MLMAVHFRIQNCSEFIKVIQGIFHMLMAFLPWHGAAPRQQTHYYCCSETYKCSHQLGKKKKTIKSLMSVKVRLAAQQVLVPNRKMQKAKERQKVGFPNAWFHNFRFITAYGMPVLYQPLFLSLYTDNPIR